MWDWHDNIDDWSFITDRPPISEVYDLAMMKYCATRLVLKIKRFDSVVDAEILGNVCLWQDWGRWFWIEHRINWNRNMKQMTNKWTTDTYFTFMQQKTVYSFTAWSDCCVFWASQKLEVDLRCNVFIIIHDSLAIYRIPPPQGEHLCCSKDARMTSCLIKDPSNTHATLEATFSIRQKHLAVNGHDRGLVPFRLTCNRFQTSDSRNCMHESSLEDVVIADRLS